MKPKQRNSIIVLAIVCMMVFPGIANAATIYYNLKINFLGNTQTLTIPISKSDINTMTVKYVYTYKDGKWVLTSKANSAEKTDKVDLQKPSLPAPTPTPTVPVANDDKPAQTQDYSNSLTSDEQKMLELVNAERQKAGVMPLRADMTLTKISREKSKDMIDKGYFSHTSPTFGSPFDVLKANGVAYRYAGENLAGASTVELAHKNLMASPGHRANILNPNYNYVGIGIVDGGPYGKMYTQTFIGTK